MTEVQKTHWYDKTWLVVILCIVFFPVGLYGLWKSSKIGIIWKVIVSVLFAVVLFGRGGSQSATTPAASSNEKVDSASVKNPEPETSNTQAEPPTAVPVKMVGMNEVLSTDYFEVSVISQQVVSSIDMGFKVEEAGAGNKFLILEVAYKNIDTESRFVLGDHVFVDYNGKKYDFSKQELILLDGYGVLGEINPLTTITSKIVYKIPAELTGNAYYQPSRADADQLIDIGLIQ
jgi:hypothetical protein